MVVYTLWLVVVYLWVFTLREREEGGVLSPEVLGYERGRCPRPPLSCTARLGNH